MKKVALVACLFFGIIIIAKSQAPPMEVEKGTPEIFAKFKWELTTHDFGKIPKGTPVTAEFTFTNEGSTPLIISNVKSSCGCTVADYTKEAVEPGKTGIVKAKYNAASVGAFTKSIRVTANVEGGTETLYIKGEVTQE